MKTFVLPYIKTKYYKGGVSLKAKTTFRRLEKKFLLTTEQFLRIKEEIDRRFDPDEYGETKICNLYFDTPSYLLIRRSIEKPIFKEKLRLRTYGVPSQNSQSFIEIKRKYNSEVYKRRIGLPLNEALDFLESGKELKEHSQISGEIEYFISMYENLEPMFYISCDRSAFFYKNNKDIRVTFDKNLTWRNYDLDLTKGSYGELLLPTDMILMEIKIPDAIPLWLAKLLSELGVVGASFSKVGNAYINMIKQRSVSNEQTVSKYIY